MLFDYICNKDKGFDEEDCRFFAIQLCEAMIFLNSLGLVHRDIKTENILVHDGRL